MATLTGTLLRYRVTASVERLRALLRTHTVTETAQLLGISRRTLYRILREHPDLNPPGGRCDGRRRPRPPRPNTWTYKMLTDQPAVRTIPNPDNERAES